jgi:MarR family 2-MHQ and catechol resistance regulon transcriptional repressor
MAFPQTKSPQMHDQGRASSERDLTDSPALKLWVVMARAHVAIQTHAAADVARHDLTLAEFGIIEALYHRGPMLLGEVQRRILVSSGGITFLVDRLTAKGYVERRACETDRRARYAALTAKGEELIAKIFPSHAAAIERAMAGLSESEQRQATELIKKLGLAAARCPVPGHTPD